MNERYLYMAPAGPYTVGGQQVSSQPNGPGSGEPVVLAEALSWQVPRVVLDEPIPTARVGGIALKSLVRPALRPPRVPLQPGNDTTVRQPASRSSRGYVGLSCLGRPARTGGAVLSSDDFGWRVERETAGQVLSRGWVAVDLGAEQGCEWDWADPG